MSAAKELPRAASAASTPHARARDVPAHPEPLTEVDEETASLACFRSHSSDGSGASPSCVDWWSFFSGAASVQPLAIYLTAGASLCFS